MSDYPADFNPRAELKEKSEKYADYIYYGLPYDKPVSSYDTHRIHMTPEKVVAPRAHSHRGVAVLSV